MDQQLLLSTDTLTATLPVSASKPTPAPAALPVTISEPAAISSVVPDKLVPGQDPGAEGLNPEPTQILAAASTESTPTAEQPAPQAADKGEPPAPPGKMMVVAKALRNIEQNIANIIRLLEEGNGEAHKTENGNGNGNLHLSVEPSIQTDIENSLMKPVDGRVVEGVFDGTQMVGSDGKTYMVPANYASKSKLVEGDMLKLTITPKGSFIYKQIGPIERSRIVASLGFDQTISEFYATSENRRWAVLKASVTYFRGEPGDEVVILVPKANPSKWAAVENIIKRDPFVVRM